MGFTGFYRVLPGFTGFYWVLLGFTGFYWVLPGFTGFYWVLLGLSGFARDFVGGALDSGFVCLGLDTRLYGPLR